jgi:signal transduction histidine kinase
MPTSSPTRAPELGCRWVAVESTETPGRQAVLVSIALKPSPILRLHRLTVLVVAVGFGTSLGGFFADTFPWVSLLFGPIGTLVVATLLDRAVTRHDKTLGLLQELEGKNSQLEESLSCQVQAELSLRQAQRMDAVGQLAGGIAHDFNNLLQSILSYSEFLSDAIDPDSELQEDVAEVRKAAQRGAGLTRQLQVFSRQHVTDPVVVNLNDSIRGAEHLIRSALGDDIDLACTTPEDPCLVLADMAELEQMLMNLAINARDAMPCGGQIEVKVDTVELLESGSLAADLGPGQFARIDVRDNGHGMPPEVAAKAFEPFFTTKETGRGAGLGLAMVYGIANRAGGGASITSVGGEGTTVTVLFPLANQDEKSMDGSESPHAIGTHRNLERMPVRQ